MLALNFVFLNICEFLVDPSFPGHGQSKRMEVQFLTQIRVSLKKKKKKVGGKIPTHFTATGSRHLTQRPRSRCLQKTVAFP